MSGGYINQGGELRSNGRSPHKYVIQQPSYSGKQPFLIPRGRAYFLIALAMAALVAAFLLAWFLSPGYGNATSLCPIDQRNAAKLGSDGPLEELMYHDDKTVHDPNAGTGTEKEPYRPSRYKIFLSPNISSSQTYGEVYIDFECFENDAEIIIDIGGDMLIQAEKMTLHDVSDTQEQSINIKKHDYLPDFATRTRFSITPEKAVEGKKYRVYMPFNGRLNDKLQGFYKASYIDLSGHQRWLASTQFSPTDARRAFPCFDRPALKATFEISMERPNELRTISNMPMDRSEPSDSKPGHTIDYFPETIKMSTYLVAFIVSDLMGSETLIVPIPGTGKSFPLRAWSRPEVLDQTEYARNLSVSLLEYYQGYFGIDFPMPKIDIVAVPEFGFNAMENWGLITFRESAMLIADKITSESRKETVATVISHELAHQWFGNLVTPAWWNDLWLKEGFATYVEFMGVDYAHPTWRMTDKFLVNEIQECMNDDASKSSHPLSVPVSTDAEIRRIFDPISYTKGASIIRMMEHFLGANVFKSGLKRYLNAHLHANARQDELFADLTAEALQSSEQILPANVTVKDIMDTWTLQAGFPVLDVKRHGKEVTFTQSKFILPSNDSSDGSRWWLPISLTSASDLNATTKPVLWLSPKSDSLSFTPPKANENDYILANLNQTGFYRVNYDNENWNLLIEAYYELPDLTRAQLLDDSFALARAHLLEYEIPLIFASRLSHDMSPVAWQSASRPILHLNRMMSREPAYGAFRTFMRAAVNGIYRQLDFEEKPDDDHLTKLHRPLMINLACALDHPDCLNRAQYMMRLWMRDEEHNPISPDVRLPVYCAGIKQGNVEEWDFAFKKFKASNVPSEKMTLLSAMGCSRDPWILARYLEMTLEPNSPFSKQDGALIFEVVAGNKHGFDLATSHLIDNFKKIYEYYGEGFSTVKKMIHALALYMNKDSDKKKLAAFAKELDLLGIESAKRHLQTATEDIMNNIYWRSHGYYNLEKWVKEFNAKFHIV
ncbi:aminopeptidase N-like isoform X2 [Ctenocephalides felis]|uniref:aminopeptidase N-like isoform X2 n=1 Tax=Ctenocephalides felis TaxID=7515 RepID=UPI000E6E56A5|nr:aminopeptidase N-like isoform X2 [Ctenocephalides felis]